MISLVSFTVYICVHVLLGKKFETFRSCAFFYSHGLFLDFMNNRLGVKGGPAFAGYLLDLA